MRRLLTALALLVLGGSALPAQQTQAAAAAPQQFVCILHLVERLQSPANWTAEDNQVAARHMAYLKQLTDAGTAVLVGRTPSIDAHTVGIIIFEAGSMEEAKQLMQSDPLEQAGMSTREVLPFRIFMQRKPPA